MTKCSRTPCSFASSTRCTLNRRRRNPTGSELRISKRVLFPVPHRPLFLRLVLTHPPTPHPPPSNASTRVRRAAQLDNTGDARVDQKELEAYLRRETPDLTKRDAWLIMNCADTNNDKVMTFDEFSARPSL